LIILSIMKARSLHVCTMLLLLLISNNSSNAFFTSPSKLSVIGTTTQSSFFEKTTTTKKSTSLYMANDLVTYLRTEWISAALCSNQITRESRVCLQLGSEDGRAVTFIPRSVKKILTSSAEADGKLTVSARRQLLQNEKNRRAGKVELMDQAADDLTEVGDNSVDVVISLQCAQRLLDNGRSWKKSIQEAARVLKPGGRLLWVEQTELNGESYLDYVESLNVKRMPVVLKKMKKLKKDPEEELKEDDTMYPVFDEIGWDDVSLVLVPHIAGLAVKAMDPVVMAMKAKQDEEDRLDDLAFKAFERGTIKRKKRRKKKKGIATTPQDSKK